MRLQGRFERHAETLPQRLRIPLMRQFAMRRSSCERENWDSPGSRMQHNCFFSVHREHVVRLWSTDTTRRQRCPKRSRDVIDETEAGQGTTCYKVSHERAYGTSREPGVQVGRSCWRSRIICSCRDCSTRGHTIPDCLAGTSFSAKSSGRSQCVTIVSILFAENVQKGRARNLFHHFP